MAFDVKDPPPLPSAQSSWFNPDGTPTTVAYLYFSGIDRAFRLVLKFLRTQFP